MSAAAPAPSPLPIPLPFPQVPYAQACWPSAARKVWNCLRYYIFRWRINDGKITITDRIGSQWCTASYGESRYGSTGRRCWQKGLKQLEDMGYIVRHREHGGRSITIMIKFHEAKKARRGRPAAAAQSPPPPAPKAPEPSAAEPPPTEEERRQHFAAFRAEIDRINSEADAARKAAKAVQRPTIPFAEHAKKAVKGVPVDDVAYLEVKEKVGALTEAEKARLDEARGNRGP